MKNNMFVKLAENLFSRKRPNFNLRHDLKLRDTRSCMEEVVGHKLKRNKSYFSLLIGGSEVFLGEVNYDLSDIPAGLFHHFAECVTARLSDELIQFIKSADKELVEKLHDRINDGNYKLRYIVNPDTDGACLSFYCHLDWNNPLFQMQQVYCSYLHYGREWLDYWCDRKRYFAG